MLGSSDNHNHNWWNRRYLMNYAEVQGIHLHHPWRRIYKGQIHHDFIVLTYHEAVYLLQEFFTCWFDFSKSKFKSSGKKVVSVVCSITLCVNTLRPIQNGRRFADDTFKCIFLNENVRISIKISLMFVPKGPINNISALVQIMAWRRSGDKPLSEPIMVSLLTHICVTRP